MVGCVVVDVDWCCSYKTSPWH